MSRPRKFYGTEKEYHRLYDQKLMARNRALFNRAKCVPCHDCGVQYSPWVMEFDHRDPKDKKFDIARALCASLKTIEAELKKCDVVCANCHCERTHRQRVSGLLGKTRLVVADDKQISLLDLVAR